MADFSGFGSSSGTNLLVEAKRANATNAGSTSHKIMTKLKYTARKQGVISGPKNFAKAALGKVPFVGSILTLAADIAIGMIEKKERIAKAAKYRDAVDQGGSDRESLRKLAKWEAKSLKDLAEALERNQVKLKDAADKTVSAYTFFKQNNGSDASIDGILIAVCEEERYIAKVALMLAGIAAAAGEIEKYIDEAREANLEVQATLVKELDNIAVAHGTAINTPPGPPPLPPRPGMGPPPIPPRPGVVLNRPGGPPPVPPRPKWP